MKGYKAMKQSNFRNLQMQQAIERLEILEKEYLLHENVLKEFKEDGTIYYSENLGGAFSGILYWLENKNEYVEKVRKIEKERNIFVYHCILNHTIDGDLLTMLYISEYQDEWEYEKNDLKNGCIDVYVCNLSRDIDSEFGSVQITGVNGGLVRVY